MSVASAVAALATRVATEFNTLRGQLTTSLAAKADDSVVVKLSGTQSVDGAKTFTVAPLVPTPGSPGNPVRNDDTRLTNTRTPTAGSVTNSSIAGGAAIDETKLALASDAAAGVASRRTLGTGALQAASGADSRFTNNRIPLDSSVTDAKVAVGAAIAEAKLSLASDAAAGTASRRTIGTGALQAAAGNHTHAGSSSTGTFNVRDYGATGNGSTDDLAAINATIAACPAGGKVWLPPGIYLISAPVDIPSNITVEGCHGDTLVYSSGVATPPCTLRVGASFTGAAAIRLRGKSQTGLSVDHVGARLRDLTIDATSSPAGTEGVSLYGFVREALFERVTVVRSAGNGFECDGPAAGDRPQSLRFVGCVTHDVGGSAFYMNETADTTWLDCNAQGAGQYGFYLVNAPNGLMSACRAEWSGLHGFAVVGAWGTWQGSGGISLTGCLTDRSARNGVYVSATGGGQVQVTGCTFRRDGRNGGSGGGGYGAVLVDPAATMRVIVSNIAVYPGVDDGGTGTNSPQLGVSAPAGGPSVSVSSGDIHVATSPLGGGANLSVAWDTIGVATGTAAAPTRRAAGAPFAAGTLPATWTPDYANSPQQTGVAGAAVTINPPSATTLAPRDGARVSLAVTATGASRVITLGAAFGSLVGWPSSLQLPVGKVALIRMEWNATAGRWVIVTFTAEA